MPDGAAAIGEFALADCVALTQVILPESLTSIGEDAFFDCYHLTLTVSEDSCAEWYAKENDIPYVFITE